MIAYRQATEADAPAVLSLLEEIMEHHGAYPPERERLASIVSRIIAGPDHCFLLAEAWDEGEAAAGVPTPAATGASAGAPAGGAQTEAGAAQSPAGRIVGMCALLFTLSTWSAAPVCELQDVIVTAEYRRGEVGAGLIAEAEEIARERGCARMQLLAESWNLGAHAFYRSLGLAEKTCLYFERDLSGDSPPI